VEEGQAEEEVGSNGRQCEEEERRGSDEEMK